MTWASLAKAIVDPMASEAAKNKGRSVLVVLMKGDEADATISAIRQDQPGATIADHGTFWQIGAQDELLIDMARVGEELGREIDLGQWLTIMTTFVGRVEVEEGRFRITSEMLELDRPSH